MTIQEEILEVEALHDSYASARYEEHKTTALIDLFREWHNKASVLFSKYINEDDSNYIKFINIESGNCHVLANQFGFIEPSYHILIERTW